MLFYGDNLAIMREYIPDESVSLVYCSQHRHLNLESWLPDATENDISFVSQALFGLAQLYPQLREALAAEVLQLNTLEVLPDPLVRVEIRSVAGQLFELHPRSCPARQKVLDCPSPMYRRAVPNHQQLARNLAHEVL